MQPVIQTLLSAAAVTAALAYLLVCLRRFLRRARADGHEQGGGCGGCGGGTDAPARRLVRLEPIRRREPPPSGPGITRETTE